MSAESVVFTEAVFPDEQDEQPVLDPEQIEANAESLGIIATDTYVSPAGQPRDINADDATKGNVGFTRDGNGGRTIPHSIFSV